ncbi:MAG: uroporphyrinogen-III synthase [Candidatus Obscuribacterales bacterium]
MPSRVLVTRAQSQADSTVRRLLEAGHQPIDLPVIEFGDPGDGYAALDRALEKVSGFDWIVFASTNAVSRVLERCRHLGVALPSAQKSSGLRLAAIGSATADALSEAGLEVDFVPGSFVAESFVDEFRKLYTPSGMRILWPRTSIGRTLIATALSEEGALVEMVEAYSTGLPADRARITEKLMSLLSNREVDVITFASSQTVKNFAALLQSGITGDTITEASPRRSSESNLLDRQDKLLSGVRLAVIGPVTASTTASYLRPADIEAATFTIEGLIEALDSQSRDAKPQS